MSNKKCDNCSVGIIARRGDKILMIERKKFPYGFAPPAGHVDGDNYIVACHKELREETGLRVIGAPKPIVLSNGGYRGDNKCRREGGDYHFWQIFSVECEGELTLNKDETRGVGWLTIDTIKNLAELTEKYLEGEIQEEQWMLNPGLEPVWYGFFKELNII